MKNEPVAWMLDYEISGIQGGEYRTNPFRHKNPRWDGNYEIREVTNAIPLYTHPVKEQDTDCQYCKQGCIRCDARKQLTDEEMYALLEKYQGIELCKAILRKAQEK